MPPSSRTAGKPRAPAHAGIPLHLALTVIRCHRASHLDDLPQRFETLLGNEDATTAERVRVHRWYGQFALEASPFPLRASWRTSTQPSTKAKYLGPPQ